ncbi:MAG: hypothetical protein HZC43_10565 [Nitrosomonadales bacterium]|nr:hypothetical protein [Nitrosomonadales bacterium]
MRHFLHFRTLLPGFALLLAGCAPSGSPPKFTTEYQAVFMDNGQVFFGKLEQAGGDYPLLRNVFTVQNQADPATKEVKSALVRRSVELHGPDYTVLNAKHILAIEPVAENSRVAQVIKQAESQAAAPARP